MRGSAMGRILSLGGSGAGDATTPAREAAGVGGGGVLLGEGASISEREACVAGSDERGALVEPGPVLGAELRGERTERADGGDAECDCDEHEMSIGACASSL